DPTKWYFGKRWVACSKSSRRWPTPFVDDAGPTRSGSVRAANTRTVNWGRGFRAVANWLMSAPISERICSAARLLRPGTELTCSTAVRKGPNGDLHFYRPRRSYSSFLESLSAIHSRRARAEPSGADWPVAISRAGTWAYQNALVLSTCLKNDRP